MAGFFGRRKSSPSAPGAPATPAMPDLVIPPKCESFHCTARWEDMEEGERLHVLRLLNLPTPAAAPASPMPASYLGDLAFQHWYTQLAKQVLQPDGVAAIQAWLGDAPPHAHLSVVGPSNRGCLAVIRTLAPPAVAQMPPAPDYCYVPDPARLDQRLLLALAPGTSTAFQEALAAAIERISTHGWSKEGITQIVSQADTDAFEQLAEAAFTRLISVSPPTVTAYVADLKQAIRQTLNHHMRPRIAPSEAIDSPGTVISGRVTAPLFIEIQPSAEPVQALLRARGGVLVLSTERAEALWPHLRAVLHAGELHVSTHGGQALPYAARVIIVGTGDQYRSARKHLDGFDTLFRYKAIFNADMEWTREGEAAYAALTQRFTALASLPALSASGIAAVIEEGARRAEYANQRRLTTDLAFLNDLITDTARHAQALAGGTRAGAPGQVSATRSDVDAVITRRQRQLGRQRDELFARIISGRWRIPTHGNEVGAITGMGVFENGPEEESYGEPVRHTVTISPGTGERLIDIEREANVADPSHTYGALTMIGYLAWKYGHDQPIGLIARLRGEQRGGAAGSSASAAELFILLSALSGVPIFRSRAVTGAVGQHGDIQPIGGVNYKIEGFWQLCKHRWDTDGERPNEGGFGMLIPKANVQDLMLRPEIARQIEKDRWFTIWPIETIDEGLFLLTGMPAEHIHRLAKARLAQFHQMAHQLRSS